MIPTTPCLPKRSKVTLFVLLVVGILLFTQPVQADLTTNLHAYWTLDNADNSGNTAQDVHATYDMTNYSATPGSTCVLNECYDFDGSSSELREADRDYNTISTQVWINFDNLGTNEYLLSKDGSTRDWFLLKLSGGAFNFYVNDGGLLGSGGNVTPSTGTWYHVVGTFDGDKTRVYVNGALSGTSASTSGDGNIDNGNAVHVIGARDPSASDVNAFIDGKIDEVAIWGNRVLNLTEIQALYNSGSGCSYTDLATDCVVTPPTLNASDHLTETLTKQEQLTNVTLNSIAYSTIYSYSFTPTYNDTNFYQYFTIPVNPTTSNTLTCKVQLNGIDLGAEHSRTNTAGEVGQILLKTTNTTIDAESNTVALLCKRTGGGSMVLFDIVGTGHLLKDIGSGVDVFYESYTFTNTSTGMAIIEEDTFTTNSSNVVDPTDQQLILEFTGTITNNGASAETLALIPYIGNYNCSTTYRYVTNGGSGSVGGTCISKNVTNGTAYDIGFWGNGTNAEYDFTYDVKEIHVEDHSINSTSIDWTKGAETGLYNISTLQVQQDVGAGQDVFSALGISHTGTGNAIYYLSLGGDATNQSNTFQRNAESTYGVLGAHNTFYNLATGNYTIALTANVDTISTVVAEFITYEAGKQIITIDQSGITANNNYDNTSITSFSITLGNGNSYSTTTGNINIPEQGLQNITYSATGYNDISYTNINTSNAHKGYLCQVYIHYLATDTLGNSISYPYNITYNGTTTHILNNQNNTCMNGGQAETVTFSSNIWHNKTETINKTAGSAYNYTFTNIGNAWLKFQGATSIKDYSSTIQCTLNGTYLTKYNTYIYTFYENSSTLTCDDATNYPSFETTLNTTPTQNQTISVTEYSLSLTFDANVTGNVTWTHDTDANSRGQYPYWNASTGYNATSFEWIRIKANWSENTLVKVTFNEKLTGAYNSSVQYYNFRNDLDVSVVENVKVLDQLDGTLWVKVLNYAQEELIEATVRVSYCPTQVGTECEIVSQILTEPQGGGASPGNPIYLDTSLDYWISVTKAGYESQALLVRGQDLIDDEILEVKLPPLVASNAYNHHIFANKYHSNESSIFIITSYVHGGTYFWNTSYNSAINSEAYQNGGDWFILTGGTHYNWNQDFTLHLYTYDDSTGDYTEVADWLFRYREIDNRSIIDKIGDNPTLRVILWIMLILLAGILGTYITRDGLDTGYYIFAGGSVLLAFILPAMFLPIAGVFAIIGIGSMIFSVTRE